MCCGMQINSLYHKVLECKENGTTAGFSVHPRNPAAPYDDLLFDSVRLYAKSADGNEVEISGTVSYWHPSEGYWKTSAVIRRFEDIDACLTWLKNEIAAGEECANVLYGLR